MARQHRHEKSKSAWAARSGMAAASASWHVAWRNGVNGKINEAAAASR